MPLARILVALVAAVLLAACGGDGSAPPPRVVPAADAEAPRLARRAAEGGEVLVRGEGSPASHGPYALHGRYVVRFEQYAPENPELDFGTQTSFTASIDPRREVQEAGSVALFEEPARTGRRTVRLDGRYYLDVSFGDFPYVIRLTPR